MTLSFVYLSQLHVYCGMKEEALTLVRNVMVNRAEVTRYDAKCDESG